MSITYTISTVDSPEYKHLICGRTDDIAKLLDHISVGRSVALFGERRIGKTSLLYSVRDVINGEVDSYRSDLIDLELKHAVESLKTKTPHHQAVYLDLLAMDKPEAGAFVKLLHKKLQATALQNALPETQTLGLLERFERLNNALAKNKRLVVLIDEVEALLAAKGGSQLFRNLRSVIQSCPRICFVLAGAEDWHKQIKEKTSPLVNNVQTFYLKAAGRFPTERYLITNPLKHNLPPGQNISRVVHTIVKWTECKSWYVQAVCQAVVELGAEVKKLPDNWGAIVEKRVEDSVEATLTAFYVGDNLDDVSQKILAVLANKPSLTVKEIGNSLGYSEKIIWDKIGDLEALDKVRKQGSEYCIAGTFIEQWGQKTQDIPPLRNPWPQRAKWAGAIISLILAVWIYFYVHPPLQTFSFDFPGGVAMVRIPASLEQNETGTTIVSIQNTGQTQIFSTTVSLISSDIEYKKDGSNQAVFEVIGIGETKFWESTFTSHSSASGNSFASQILIANDAIGLSKTYPFDINKRVWPIKQFWGIISAILVAAGGFIVKQDLGQLISSLTLDLLKSRDKN